MGRAMVRVRASFAWLAILVGVGVQPAGSTTGWDRFVEPQLGTSIDYPIGIFSVDEGVAPRGIGRQFRSKDGHAVLAVYSQNNEGDSPARYMERNFKVPRQTIDYKKVTSTFFAISAIHAGEIYYSRCNFSRRPGEAIHCFDLRYPAREKRAWDPIVTRISLSLRPLDKG
jgi:hypothetical protein